MNEKKKARKNEILDAAMQVFSDKGYDKASVDDIVEASGLSKGTLYWHFKNKQALFSALLQRVAGDAIAMFDELMASANDLSPPDALKALYDGSIQIVENNAQIFRLMVDFMLQGMHDEQIKEQYGSYYAGYQGIVANIIRRGIDEGYFEDVDAQAVAIAIIGSLDGISLITVFEGVAGIHWDLGNAINVSRELMLRGLMKEGDND